MAARFQTSVREVQRKLHNLRCQYTGELRKARTKKSGKDTADTYRSQWPYKENMKFLEGSISLRSSVGNELPPPLQEPEEQVENSQEEDQLMARANEIFDSPRNDLQKFGDFVAAELRALRNPLLMRQAKRSIMRILLDTSAADDDPSTP
ncbi:hypothetical protein L798_00468 [Zootermopsis nevadensis]|uniref:MADF domain-containing protein n=2 Tax=Zootermopsis nevadensis TaxID=136037 RepID=A0A067RDR7_ZOONE|nr:hypothetical protein L798_00468 [Zootermopsis nevadensis]